MGMKWQWQKVLFWFRWWGAAHPHLIERIDVSADQAVQEESEYFPSLTVPQRWATWEHHLPMTPPATATLMRSSPRTDPVLHWIIQPRSSQTFICADLDAPADSQEVVCSPLGAEMHSSLTADTFSYSSIDLCSDMEEIKALCHCFSSHCSFWERVKWSLLVSPSCMCLLGAVHSLRDETMFHPNAPIPGITDFSQDSFLPTTVNSKARAMIPATISLVSYCLAGIISRKDLQCLYIQTAERDHIHIIAAAKHHIIILGEAVWLTDDLFVTRDFAKNQIKANACYPDHFSASRHYLCSIRAHPRL